ncbi:MAG: FkbM family methyltransferase, partial [Pseudomonadota bacterium]
SQTAEFFPSAQKSRHGAPQRPGETLRFVNVHQSHASAHLALDGDAGANDTVEEVETVCIDDLVPGGISALIKLDVEGAEIAAIDGADRTIREGSVFIYEDHGSDLGSAVTRHFMGQGGIAVFAIETRPQRVPDAEHLARIKTDRYKGYNFLAGREDSGLLAAIIDCFEKNDGADKPNASDTGGP